MTRRHSTLLFCAAALLPGTIATVFQAWVSSPVAAQATPGSYQNSDPADALIRNSQILARISARTTPSVVHIQSEHVEDGRTIEETGSGVLIRSGRANGTFVVTNSHVIRNSAREKISVHLSNGLVVNPIRMLEDPESDIAVMEIPSNELPTARWGDSQQVEIGNLVLAMGSPFGLSQSVTMGIISAKGRRDLSLDAKGTVKNQDFLQTDAAINPGNSGGPLIDLHGNVIGINTAIASNSGGNEGIGFSIPSNIVRRVVDHLLYYGRVRRAYLGVALDPDFSLTAARRLGLDRTRGARIVKVYSAAPASKARLQNDDVITRFGDIEVLDENHLINLVSLADVESQVRLQVLRAGQRMYVNVILSEKKRSPQISRAKKPERMTSLPPAERN
jgi:serine protease Do